MDKKELIRIAGELKSCADRILDLAKEESTKDKETPAEDKSESYSGKDPKMMALMIKKKMGR